MRRGAPSTLKLVRLPTRVTPKRAPGPGPIQIDMWAELAQQHIVGEDVVYHTGSARAYDRVPDEQTLHTKVVHKRKYEDGVLIKPKYTELVTLQLPNGSQMQVVKAPNMLTGSGESLGVSLVGHTDPKMTSLTGGSDSPNGP
eukprot:5974344-Amphidinium_carterae.1